GAIARAAARTPAPSPAAPAARARSTSPASTTGPSTSAASPRRRSAAAGTPTRTRSRGHLRAELGERPGDAVGVAVPGPAPVEQARAPGGAEPRRGGAILRERAQLVSECLRVAGGEQQPAPPVRDQLPR